ncbi:Uncharacterised protein [Mycobacteroides abscessus subsp. abscessus]|nr:Uncharacterised protein [Mycobacteroides abscessus subsp. abscessus]
MTSPLGVKTKISGDFRSKRSDSRNSAGSAASRCQSSSWRIHAMSSTSARSPECLPLVSLYRQCAAMPNSAVRCMSWVRICTSSGLPSGPTTVVCSDW